MNNRRMFTVDEIDTDKSAKRGLVISGAHQGIDVAERHANGLATDDDLAAAWDAAWAAAGAAAWNAARDAARDAARAAAVAAARDAARANQSAEFLKIVGAEQ